MFKQTITSSGYKFTLTNIAPDMWQFYIYKQDELSDFIRILYGITEQIGGCERYYKVLKKYILTPKTNSDSVFLYQFNAHEMKNWRVWAAFETIKRMPDKKGVGQAAYIALSPVQSKWKTATGSTTILDEIELRKEEFKRIYQDSSLLDNKVHKLITVRN